jgi:hypothetical protein
MAMETVTEKNLMTPRERKDIPWIVTVFVIVIIVTSVGALLRWHHPN